MSRLDLVGALVGFIALEYGLAQWSHPVAWAVGGGLVLVSALWPDPRKVGR